MSPSPYIRDQLPDILCSANPQDMARDLIDSLFPGKPFDALHEVDRLHGRGAHSDAAALRVIYDIAWGVYNDTTKGA